MAWPTWEDGHEYAEKVVSGEILASKPTIWAADRYLRDLEDPGEYYFDARAADHFIRFCSLIRHYKGRLGHGEGARFKPAPWQCFIFANIFGWKRQADGFRRFRTAWVRIPKKNGKTFMAATIGLYGLVLDNEPGAEIYTAATKRDQARKLHTDAITMRAKSPELRKRIGKRRDSLFVEKTQSFFRPLGADASTEDGAHVHMAILDEVHAHRSGAMWDQMESATVARDQPIMFGITTAGFDPLGFGATIDAYFLSILDPSSGVVNDRAFVYVSAADEKADWRDEETWIRANPNLGAEGGVSLESLREAAEKAKDLPRDQANFKTKHLNLWVRGESTWIDVDTWDACRGRVDTKALAGLPCYAGLDLAHTLDLSAFVLLWADYEGDVYYTRQWYWCPEESARTRSRRDRVAYLEWAEAGHIEMTPGNVTDFAYIRRRIRELARSGSIREVAYDRKFASQLVVELGQDGMEMVPTSQGYDAISGPSKSLKRRILQQTIVHDGNPVMRWNVGNVTVQENLEGQIRPVKGRSRERIDGAVALVMSIDRADRHRFEGRPSQIVSHVPGGRGSNRREILDL